MRRCGQCHDCVSGLPCPIYSSDETPPPVPSCPYCGAEKGDFHEETCTEFCGIVSQSAETPSEPAPSINYGRRVEVAPLKQLTHEEMEKQIADLNLRIELMLEPKKLGIQPESPSEPAANAYDNDGNPIALSVTNGKQASADMLHDPTCYLYGKPCVECKAADEARDHFAAHYVIKRGDGNMHYADAVKSGWDAAIEFVKGGK